jgi:RNA polymerase sigma-70 factor (ECF subfamily)
MSRLHRGRKQLRERLTEYAKDLGYSVKTPQGSKAAKATDATKEEDS